MDGIRKMFQGLSIGKSLVITLSFLYIPVNIGLCVCCFTLTVCYLMPDLLCLCLVIIKPDTKA